MAQSKILDTGQSKSLECSICFSDFVEPKQLSCLHNFCLKCLTEYCSDSKYGDKKACPLCRAEFPIPQGGVEELPNNEFLMRISLTKGDGKKNEKPLICEICAGLGDDVEAESFCMECKQCLCTRCKKCHLLQTATSSHNVVNVCEKPNDEKLRKMQSSYCLKHANEESRFYCCDCNEVICCLCHVNDHGKHVCKLFDEVVQQKKDLFLNGGISIQRCLKEGNDKLKKLQQEQEKTLQEVSSAEQCIEETFSNIIEAITKYKSEVLENLVVIKAGRLKEIESQKDLDEFYNTELNSLLIYSRMLVEKGTDCEIMKAADDIFKRTEELIKSHDERNKQGFPDCSIKFQASSMPRKEDLEKFLGSILDTESAKRFLSSGLTTFLEIAKLGKAIRGITVINDQLFIVLEKHPQVNVYDSHTLRAQPHINIPDLKNAQSLAGCTYNKALYVSDVVRCIHRVNLIDKSVKNWQLNKQEYFVCKLSVTFEHNLLVTVGYRDFNNLYRDYSVVLEYTDAGQLIREIGLDKSLEVAYQTIQISAEQFIVCFGLDYACFHGLCIMNSNGRAIKKYGRDKGSGNGKLNVPVSLTIGQNRDLLFLADKFNDRVLMFNRDLKLLGHVQTRENLMKPSSIYFDTRSNRLFVGEDSGRVLLIGLNH